MYGIFSNIKWIRTNYFAVLSIKLREKYPYSEFFWSIFPRISSPNEGKYEREKLRMRKIPTQCNIINLPDKNIRIFYYLYFLRISKVWSKLHHGPVGQAQIKERCSLLTYTFWHFLLLFFIKRIVFLSFSFLFFWQKIKFPLQNINQSKTWVGDKKLLDQLYITQTSNMKIHMFQYWECNIITC